MTTRLIVLPDCPSRQPLLELLRLLQAQQLLETPIRLVEGSDELVVRDLRPEPEHDVVQPLADAVEAARSDRFVVFNVVLADSIEQRAAAAEGEDSDDRGDAGPVHAPEVRVTMRVDRLIRDALALVDTDDEIDVQRLDVVNVLMPAGVPGALPRDVHNFGWDDSPSGWSNVVVSPEVQETATQASVVVGADAKYVAHVGVSLATIAGLWAGNPWEPALPGFDDDGGLGPSWTVIRCRSRSVIAPELPQRVLGRVGRSVGRLPTDGEIEFRIAPEPPKAIELARDQLVNGLRLSREHPIDTSLRPPPIRVTLPEFFRLLWRWLTGRLHQYVVDRVEGRVHDAQHRINSAVNRTLQLDESTDLRVTVFDVPEESEVDPEDASAMWTDEESAFRFLQPEPLVWRVVRSMCFGLLDGGDLPDRKVQRLVGPGAQRFVLPDARWISPSPGVPIFEPSQAVRDLGLGPKPSRHTVDASWAREWEAVFAGRGVEVAATDGSAAAAGNDGGGTAASAGSSDGHGTSDPIDKDAARFRVALEDARRSLLWQLDEHLDSQRLMTLQRIDELDQDLAEAREDDGETARDTARREKRSAWIRLLFSVIVLIGLAVAAVVWLPALMAGAMLTGALVVAGVVWLLLLFRSLWRCIYRWFLADHRLYWAETGRVDVLEQALSFERIQLERFTYLVTASRDWADIIAAICHHPFRQPRPVDSMRIRNPNLFLPSSHQVHEGYTSQPRLEGLVSQVAADIVTRGWLYATYTSCENYASREAELRSRASRFDPDRDVLVGPSDAGDRRVLRDAIEAGRARRYKELEVLRRVHRSIRSEEIDDLFTPQPDGQTMATFLGEGVGGVPSNLNRSVLPLYIDNDIVLPERINAAAHRNTPLPELPSVEQLIEGHDIDFPPLTYTSWALDVVERVPQDRIPLFGHGSPVQIDLSVASTLWRPPPPDDVGQIQSNPAGRPDWVIDSSSVPHMGDVISPDPDYRPHDTRGAYAFICEVDGEPLSHARNERIKYAVRSDCAPPGAMQMIRRSLQCISDVTGHEFEFDGTFSGLPGRQRSERIEIGWAPAEEFAAAAARAGHDPSGVIGLGGPGERRFDPSSTTWVLVGGVAILNADMGDHMEVGFVSGFSHGEVLLHELGHVMNLDHVASPIEIMCPGTAAPGPHLRLGPGDEAGLRQILSSAVRSV